MKAGNWFLAGLFFVAGSLLFIRPAFAFDPLAFTKFLGFQLGKNTLSDVEKSLGTAPIVSTGDAAGDIDSRYFVTRDGSIVIDFWSGEKGGDQKTLLGFTVHKSDHFKMKKGKTFRLTKPLDRVLVQGIRLGMSQKSFDDLFKGGIHSAEPFAPPKITEMSQFTKLSLIGKGKIFNKETNQRVDYDDAILIIGKFDKEGLYSLNVSRLEQNR